MKERQLLSAIPWFAELMPPVQREIERFVRIISIRRERTIFYQEDEAQTAYMILHGSIRQIKWTDSGATILVNRAYRGEWVGLPEAVRRGTYLSDATTNEESVVVGIQSPDLLRLLDHSSFRQQVVQALAISCYAAHGIIAARSPQTKIGGYLLRLLREVAEPGEIDVVETTQEAIANGVGLTRETVNRHLHELEAAGAIRLQRGRICIVDSTQLEG